LPDARAAAFARIGIEGVEPLLHEALDALAQRLTLLMTHGARISGALHDRKLHQ
jgi:hypothetical protein